MRKIAPQTIGKCLNLWKITRLTIEKWPGFYKIKGQHTQIIAIRQKTFQCESHGSTSLAIREEINHVAIWQLGGRFDVSRFGGGRSSPWFYAALLPDKHLSPFVFGARSQDLLWQESKKDPLRTNIPSLGQISPSSKSAGQECLNRRSHSRIGYLRLR